MTASAGADELTPARLTQALRLRGPLEVLAACELERFSGYADAIVRLELKLAGGAVLPVVAKVFGPQWYALSGLPELHFYRDLAPRTPAVPVPALLGAHDDPARSTALLLIEDLTAGYVPATLPLDPGWLEHLVSVLVALHAPWWDAPELEAAELFRPDEGVTRMPQALDETGLARNVREGRRALAAFLAAHAGELTAEERDALHALPERWPAEFRARVLGVGRGPLTLLHGDLHLLGNVFLSREGLSSGQGLAGGVRLIDWTQAKRGVGPHDLMYLLLPVDAPDRLERDTRLLRLYHAGLTAAGARYSWEQCLSDYRLSLRTHLWQSVFQGSLRWLRRTLEVGRTWGV